MNSEDEDLDVYDDTGRSELVKDDEMSPEEEAFMKGYDEGTEEDVEEKEDKEYLEAFEEESGEEE